MSALSLSQDGTTGNDVVTAVTAERDGSVFLAGSTNGSWDGPNNGSYVFAAVKLNVNGIEVWRWQVRRPIPASATPAREPCLGRRFPLNLKACFT